MIRRVGAAASLLSPERQIALLQFILYAMVGGICFTIDISEFLLLRYLGMATLAASAVSFVTATIANYVFCCALVFRSGRFTRGEELLRLFTIAMVGLSLNSLVVWSLAELLRLDPTLAKVLAVLPVLAWNYLGRRAMVFDDRPSSAMVALAQRVRERL